VVRIARQSKRLCIRCDANLDVGFGHLTRCLAVAEEAAQYNITSVFYGDYTGNARSRILESGHEVVPLDSSANECNFLSLLSQAPNTDYVVLDSYKATYTEQQRIAHMCRRLVLFDDFCSMPSYDHCYALLSFTSRARCLPYPASGAMLFMGPTYFPASRRLRDLRGAKNQRESAPASRLLITLGGFAPDDLVEHTMQIANDVAAKGIISSVRFLADSRQVRRLSDRCGLVQLTEHVTDIIEQYQWADLCVTGGGISKYEAAFLGVAVGVCSVNEGQHADTERFCEQGLGVNLGLGKIDRDASLDSFLSTSRASKWSNLPRQDCFEPFSFPSAVRKIFSE